MLNFKPTFQLFILLGSQLTHSALAHTIMVLHTQSYFSSDMLPTAGSSLILESEESQCYAKVTSVMSNSLRPHGLQLARLLCPWESLDKNTGVGCLFLFQGIFLTQGSNWWVSYVSCIGSWFLYHWCHLGIPGRKPG